MTDPRIEDLNIASCEALITPHDLKQRLPITPRVADSVITSRGIVRDILDRRDKRQMIVVGPCSIHDPHAALEYGTRLSELARKVEDRLYLLMRVLLCAAVRGRDTLDWEGAPTPSQQGENDSTDEQAQGPVRCTPADGGPFALRH